MRRITLRIVLGLLVCALGGAAVVVSGIVPITASSGHWPVTAWFLDFAKRRSVATHSASIEPPPLGDPALAAKGAGHYALACAPCHGGPGSRPPRVPLHMTPHPPSLSTAVADYDDEDLFYIIKHGVKFTGMPAWPTRGRDDEIWAVVAFVRQLPDLDARTYEALTGTAGAADPAAFPETATQPPHLVATCARCHGTDGAGRGAAPLPVLAGQRPQYLRNALAAYADGRRHSGIMEPVSAPLDAASIDALADYYAGLPRPARTGAQPDSEAIARGGAIANHGLGDRVPSCADCHGPSGTRRRPGYPDLAGQPADYLVLQLQLFKAGARGGSAYAHLMEPVARNLTPAQMQDVALYYASLPDPSAP